jgi:hypothetical protein
MRKIALKTYDGSDYSGSGYLINEIIFEDCYSNVGAVEVKAYPTIGSNSLDDQIDLIEIRGFQGNIRVRHDPDNMKIKNLNYVDNKTAYRPLLENLSSSGKIDRIKIIRCKVLAGFACLRLDEVSNLVLDNLEMVVDSNFTWTLSNASNIFIINTPLGDSLGTGTNEGVSIINDGGAGVITRINSPLTVAGDSPSLESSFASVNTFP